MPFVPALIEAAVGIGEAAAGAEAGEVGGDMASMARNAVDIGKQVYNGARHADDIGKIFNNGNGNNSSSGSVGDHALSGVIDSMNGASSIGGDGPFQNHQGNGDFPSVTSVSEPGPLPVANPVDSASEPGPSPEIWPAHGSGDLRI
jgi:hypothetical protein